ncbi:hypothetical protein N7474_006998 [Penicillium riverlandense]|uniref:uncharacterized protein n=1 Tax=Penicillium riverlandense TaxID=1903569 RepID=UPI0025473E77|nr:uncharacterized protein N7474_006998 [Penicillium riverlandense]KAJ5815221.1 hypothetical protein N7474_006998 [Penicillium riverlandense]
MTTYIHNLPSLTTREAIIDALDRAIIGFDRHDVPIFNSAFSSSPDVSMGFRYLPGEEPREFKGLDTIRAALLDHVGPMDTTHMTSNIRVNHKEGEETASMTCYTLAQHCPPGRGKEPDGPKYLAAGEYEMDLVFDKADGLWKIQKWVLDIIWTQGDHSVMARS